MKSITTLEQSKNVNFNYKYYVLKQSDVYGIYFIPTPILIHMRLNCMSEKYPIFTLIIIKNLTDLFFICIFFI